MEGFFIYSGSLNRWPFYFLKNLLNGTACQVSIFGLMVHLRFKFYVMKKLLITLFIIGSIVSSCSEDSIDISPEKMYPSLKVTNDLKENWRSIINVSLVGYTFGELNIEPSGDSQIFILDQGMSGGLEQVNVRVTYWRYRGITASRSIKLNFKNGETTSIKLTGCDGAEGCPGISLESN
jgi:hypothetical protein